MRLHRIAMPAGQAGSLAGIAAPVAATGDARHGADTGRLQVVRAQHRQGRPPSELFATAARPLDDGAIPPRSDRTGKDRPARWLTAAMLSLAVLAAAAAIVSFAAQYQMVFAAKGVAPVAALEAAIPDVAALVFATLGIALALHGGRAIRARVLNVAAVATSVAMNVLAAGRGWRDLAIWAMPPVAYALASDTAIGVVRAWALARQKDLHEVLDGEETTPLAVLGGLVLWLLRLAVAPVSTLAGFRSWVVEECPVAPGRRGRPGRRRQGVSAAGPVTAIGGPRKITARHRGAREGTKTARFLALVADRYGPLQAFPLADVSRVSAELAGEVGLDPGAARSALRRHIQSLQNGSPR